MADQVAKIAGTAPDMKAKRHAEAAVRSVEGLFDVEDEVTVDSTNEERVWTTLEDDERIEDAEIEVINRAGGVALKGQVDGKEDHNGSANQRAD